MIQLEERRPEEPRNENSFWKRSPFLVQGYRRLSVDIEAMRDTRREVRDKWQQVLENLGNAGQMRCWETLTSTWRVTRNGFPSPLGFMAEAETLLNVSAGTSHDRMRNAPAARAMLHELHTETSIFNTKEPPPERYLFILVRAGVCQRESLW